MAQAARLSLRLQKELKLLLSDPPPGAAFPHLSSSSSLSSIIAQIQGPDETVYAGGIFTVKIEIPDRYPFQPPCVTFVTPIYHPNIDTGGRICLDILNLPPKGAWQPSLNISTVLTSIGLLLSEPNPDDGLMCEASREYKYNRREFDRKAGDMTEKYAKAAAASGSSVCDGELQSLASSNALEPGPEVDTTRHESKHQATESVLEVKTSSNGLKHEAIPPVLSHKNVIGTSRKLSLESSVPSDGRGAHKKGREVPKDKMEVEETEKLLKDSGSKCNLSQEKLCGSRRKLSLGPLSQSQEKSDNVIKMDQCPSIDLPNIRVPNSGSVLSLSDNCYKQRLHLSQDSILPDENINLGSKKSRQFGNNQISGSFRTSEVDENKDEMIVKLPASDSNTNVLNEVLPAAPALGSAKNTHMIDGTGNASCDSSRKKRLCLTGKKFSLDFRGSSQTQEKDDKENVAPQMSKYNGLGSKNAHEKAAHKKLVTAQSEDNNSNMHLHYHSNKHHQDFRAAENQHQHYTDATTTTNQKKAEEPSRHEADSVIVLDSEDSDEEKTARVKFKPMLARKLLGRWRVRT